MSEKIIHISDAEKPRFLASERVMKKFFPEETEVISLGVNASINLGLLSRK